ncbi:MAG TPA: hypothetical protein VHT05_08435, partial [Candidatus Elarobacter sp.]|nr:hypothetical protein [Candidatus Elarobacter sp.]
PQRPIAPPERATFRYDEDAIEARFTPAPPKPPPPPLVAPQPEAIVEPPPPLVTPKPESIVPPPPLVEPKPEPPARSVTPEPPRTIAPEPPRAVTPEPPPVFTPEPPRAVTPEPVAAEPPPAVEIVPEPKPVQAARPVPPPVAPVAPPVVSVAPVEPVQEAMPDADVAAGAVEPLTAEAESIDAIAHALRGSAGTPKLPEPKVEEPAARVAEPEPPAVVPDLLVAPEVVAPPPVADVAPPVAEVAPPPLAPEPVVEPEPVAEVAPPPARETVVAPEPVAPPPVAPEPVVVPEPVAQAPAAATVAPVAPPEPAPAVATIARRVRLVFAHDALERALTFLEQSDYGGLITHLFAIRTLLPTAFVGLNGDVPGKLAAEREALRGVVDRLFIKMRMPRYALTAKDVEDRASRAALMELVQALTNAGPSDENGPGEASVVLEGPIDVARMVPHLEPHATDPLGSARPWLVLAELLPSSFVHPAGGDAMNVYRSSLISTFTNVTALPNEEFHRVLAGTQNAALDAALRDLRAALRDALEAASARA